MNHRRSVAGSSEVASAAVSCGRRGAELKALSTTYWYCLCPILDSARNWSVKSL